jgi:transcriptional regulator with XRE-family HTH domain
MKQEKIGAFIANLRKEKGWTQKEMASQLGVSDKAISKWETGKSLPDMGILIPVSELFGVTVDELLSGEKRNTGVTEGNVNEPNKVIIEYATYVINRIKKNYLPSLYICLMARNGHPIQSSVMVKVIRV